MTLLVLLGSSSALASAEGGSERDLCSFMFPRHWALTAAPVISAAAERRQALWKDAYTWPYNHFRKGSNCLMANASPFSVTLAMGAANYTQQDESKAGSLGTSLNHYSLALYSTNRITALVSCWIKDQSHLWALRRPASGRKTERKNTYLGS